MASAGGIDVKGLKEAQRLLEELPKTIAKRVLRKSLVRGAQPIKDEAEDLAPEDQGDLKDSIAIRSKRARPLEVGIDVGPDVKKAPHAHLVEFDTRPHLIKPVRGHTLTLGPITVTGAVQHPGTTGQPFMRPAFDNKEREARTIVGRVAGVETEKAAVRLARRRAK